MTLPAFAVVGHPNKGKSSIVSTLAHDDSVVISHAPGSTLRCRRYPMTVDGRELYVLVDTPGFQRARRLFSLLRQGTHSAAEHPAAVKAFLKGHDRDDTFRNEVELLRPLMDGAGILYVVDGSVPYGREYEAEMEILRWTGQPRMALINPIGDTDHIGEWKAALDQYFSVVRVFNAVMADFHKQTELLRAFGQLKEEWREPLERAVQSLTADRERRRAQTARIVAETISEMITLRVEEKLAADRSLEPLKSHLLERYREELQTLDGRCRDRVEEIRDHLNVTRIEDKLEILDREHLFSSETWSVFGLSKGQLVAFGALSGGAAGGIIDVALGGASLFFGALVGAGIGATTAAYATEKLVEVKVLHLALGHRMLLAGPMTNVNFPHVVFERARLHRALVSSRSHAQRGDLNTLRSVEEVSPAVPGTAKRRLERTFDRIRRGRDVVADTEELAEVIEGIFAKDDSPTRRAQQASSTEPSSM
jgi:GTPase Era involved in 16S rRNA processing